MSESAWMRWRTPIAVGSLLMLVVLAFAGSFQGAFLFDDIPAIVENVNLRDLGRLDQVLDPRPQTEDGITVDSRPLLSLTLALNFAISRTDPWSYHLFNVSLHLLNAILIYFLVEGSLRLCGSGWSQKAFGIGLAAAALWAVHPLTINAVTYVVQRAEALGVCFILIALVCSMRMALGTARFVPWWMALGVLSAFLGVSAKESAGIIPLAVALYDRSFVFDSWRSLWKRRIAYYALLAGSWVLLVWLFLVGGARSGTVGMAGGISSWDYCLIQGWALARYLGLAIFPFGFCFDYGEGLPFPSNQAMPWAILIAGIGMAALWFWFKHHRAGFPALLFFILLAPTSSFVPVQTHPIAEHRMYLPLACVVLLIVLFFSQMHWVAGLSRPVKAGAVGMLVIGLGLLTHRRNLLFADPGSLWRDSLRQWPQNWRASNNYGVILENQCRLTEALAVYQGTLQQFREAGRKDRFYLRSLENVGYVLVAMNRPAEAEPYLREVVNRASNVSHLTFNNLGLSLAAQGRWDEAKSLFARGVERKPDYAEGYNNLGWAFLKSGNPDAAEANLRRALELKPDYPEALSNLRTLSETTGRTKMLLEAAQQAHRSAPGDLRLEKALGLALLEEGDKLEGIRHLENVAEKSDPPEIGVINNLAWILATDDDPKIRNGAKAETLARKALASAPSNPVILGTLATSLSVQNRPAEAIIAAEEAVRIAREKQEATLAEEMELRLAEFRRQLEQTSR